MLPQTHPNSALLLEGAELPEELLLPSPKTFLPGLLLLFFYHNIKLVDIEALSAEILGSITDFQICSLALTLAQAKA